MAVMLGVPYGPRYNPGTGRLPAEIGEGVTEWDEIRRGLDACVGEWRFTGTLTEAKDKAREAISARIGPRFAIQTAAARYKVLIDPQTGEIIGHVSDGWVYEGADPVDAKLGSDFGAFASIFYMLRVVP